MSSISTIPERYQKGFKTLLDFSPDDFSSLLDGINSEDISSSIKILGERVSKARAIPIDQLKDIFLTISGLLSLVESEEEIDDVINNILEIIEKDKLFDGNNDIIKILTYRLNILLRTKQIYYATKSNKLITESNNVFLEARVLTDIRPVFSLKVDETPIVGMIIHNLHIHYKKDNESDHRDLYFSLDSNDITILKDVLIRAEQKELSLQNIFNKAGLKNLKE